MDERKNNLLKVIVETYIKTARPVGSKALCDMFTYLVPRLEMKWRT